MAFASSLDQIGPLAREVRDAATMLGVTSGHDPRDSTSVPAPVPDYGAALEAPIKGLRLGLPKEYMIGGLDAEVNGAVQTAVKQFEKLGAEIVVRALEKPVRTISENSGVDGAVVADEVKTRGEQNPNIGYNANTGDYVYMYQAGSVDPTRVTRSALTNASSIAGLMLTTEVMITKIDDDDKRGKVAGAIA